MRKSEYPLGTFLTTIEGGMTFLHDGTEYGDGYGVIIGMTDDGKLLKSSDYGNFCYGCDVRPATEEEIKRFIIEVHKARQIKNYSETL